MKLIISLIVCALLWHLSLGLDNGAARTPPMGWLAWERFRCNTDCTHDPNNCISENLFVDMADQLVKLGLRDVGYNLVNIDDCWLSHSRDANGVLVADPTRFPHGIKWLSDYMHSMGLQLGIYEDFGNYTCGGYPGSYGHLQIDANTFAAWGVDMLKLDGCYANTNDYATGYPQMTQYLNATGRQIIYSCSWPAYLDFDSVPWTAIGENCNLWRLYDDIDDSWDSVYTIIEYWGQKQDVLAPLAKPGQWNDPDMLITGDFSLSYEESKTQFAIWSIIAAPLLMSNDLRSISQEALSILLNKEIIAVNQDPLGIQGKRVYNVNQLEIWARPLFDKTVAVACFNGRSDGTPYPITFNFTGVGIPTAKASIRDLYAQQDLGVFSGTYTASVVPHGVVMLKVTPSQ